MAQQDFEDGQKQVRERCHNSSSVKRAEASIKKLKAKAELDIIVINDQVTQLSRKVSELNNEKYKLQSSVQSFDQRLVNLVDEDDKVKQFRRERDEFYAKRYKMHLKELEAKNTPDQITPEGNLLIMTTQVKQDLALCYTVKDSENRMSIFRRELDKFRETTVPRDGRGN